MPIYEFYCKNCDNVFEDLCVLDQKSCHCPTCQKKSSKKILTNCDFTFKNPLGTKKFERFTYKAGYNLEKAKKERITAAESLKNPLLRDPYRGLRKKY